MVVYPSRSSFNRLGRRDFYIPFIAELNSKFKPLDVFKFFKEQKDAHALLLESSLAHGQSGRYSFVLAFPHTRFRSKGRHIEVIRGSVTQVRVGHPLEILRDLFGDYPLIRETHLPPFVGGAAGLIHYEFKNQLVKHFQEVPDPYRLPEIDLGFYDRGVVFDHMKHEVYAFRLHLLQDVSAQSYEEGMRRYLEWVQAVQAEPVADPPRAAIHIPTLCHEASFKEKVLRAKDWIRSGDIFQANLSHCLEFPFEGDPLSIYTDLQETNPTSFAGFAAFEGYEVLCGSPERLIQNRESLLVTRPIAGTRPRSQNRQLDESYSLDLVLSEKERAEHVMLVDLERNDLGRVSEYGSVQVSEWMSVEKYSHVRHIVSQVQGRLRSGLDIFDVIRSVFPGGTITGAPKIRSMEIIDILENRARGPYTGSLGYIGFDGNCDLNIVIRSVLFKEKKGYLQVGAGIVADSDPDREYQETIDKAKAILQILQTPKKVSGQRRGRALVS